MKTINNQQCKSPCYKCEDRYSGCHSKCLRYIDYQQQLEVMHKAKQEYSDRMARIGKWHK